MAKLYPWLSLFTCSTTATVHSIRYFNYQYSISCQLADIGLHSQLQYQMNKSRAPSKHVCDWCISKQTHSFAQNLSQEKHLPLEKSYAHTVKNEVCIRTKLC